MMVLVDKTFGRWLGHEGGTLMNGMKALPPYSQVASPMWGHKKSATQKRAFTWQHWHFDLGISVSRTVRNKYLLFKSFSVCGILV